MKLNVGTIDRIFRVILGVALIALTLSNQIGVWGWVGLVPLLTGAISFCPLYAVLGINTCPLQKKAAS
jgi:hypothetical protein